MTQEEKAKAYDEAVKYAHYIINERCKEGTDGSFHRADLQKMFPELKESKDEKIRKRLIEYFHGFLDGYEDTYKVGGCVKWEGLDVKDVITWLEKQGEKKPYGQREECKDCQMNYAGECKGSCAMKRDEQKPVWSEEDEKMLKRSINLFNEFGGDGESSAYTLQEMDCRNCADWLKSIKERVQPQSKQEWSEDDEKVLHAIRNALNYEKPRNYLKSRDFEFTDILDWLNSLRPQNHWKPSEEQITALEAIIGCVHNNSSWEISTEWLGVLLNLKEQLKNL